jgi:hypothetical protein
LPASQSVSSYSAPSRSAETTVCGAPLSHTPGETPTCTISTRVCGAAVLRKTGSVVAPRHSVSTSRGRAAVPYTSVTAPPGG